MSSAQFSNNIKNKGSGDEKNYFNKHDEAMLKNLLKKMQNQTETVVSGDQRAKDAEDELLSLCKKHGVKANQGLLDDLLGWKVNE